MFWLQYNLGNIYNTYIVILPLDTNKLSLCHMLLIASEEDGWIGRRCGAVVLLKAKNRYPSFRWIFFCSKVFLYSHVRVSSEFRVVEYKMRKPWATSMHFQLIPGNTYTVVGFHLYIFQVERVSRLNSLCFHISTQFEL